jgi:superfamily II DNA or RNA helicase/HKD family nuclease
VSDLTRGAYDQLITEALEQQLRALDPELVSRSPLDPADAYDALTRHVAELTRKALQTIGGEDAAGLERQVMFVNKLTEAIAVLAARGAVPGDAVAESREVLEAVVDRTGAPTIVFPRRPETPLSASALLVNGRGQPRIGTEVQRELASADRVDLLCAFVKWHGLRVVEDDLAELTRRARRLRVITTTYMGATERRALDRLVELGAEVRISYETRTTRLHAKAWLFHRDTGFSTAYVGSSNLSRAALLDGLEWNVRLSAVDHGHVLDTFRATFDEYWEDSSFEPYDPTDPEQTARLDQALGAAGGEPAELPLELAAFDIRPYGYQQEVLDKLSAEREVHNRWRNLVVMATGTGKTIVAGLDYRRLQEAGAVDSLLFVAHREEILTQSLTTFRHITRDGSFGERFVAGSRPKDWRHVFASVQSLARLDLQHELDPTRFDMVIVDEFHHASESTPTYANLLRHLRPKVLLGLTATPERADGLDVRVWFDGRIAAELRLWEALERGLLVPFQYFGVHDNTDLKSVRWKRGAYDIGELTNLYTGNDARLAIVVHTLAEKVTDLRRIRALGFCVSIAHATFMARRFNEQGIASLAITSETLANERATALRRLRAREVNVLFTVDLFNEGVDLPEIDTVLFLRPTESSTVFLQQLGRGLRLAHEKPCLTVLDFIGSQHAEFRFDIRYRDITGVSRRELPNQIERGFPNLPAGCHIQLDRVAEDIVLTNVRAALNINWRSLVSELTRLGDCSLARFLEETRLSVEDIYRRQRGGWVGLRRLAGFDNREPGPDDGQLVRAVGRLLHVDDLERLNFIESVLKDHENLDANNEATRHYRLAAMLHFALWGSDERMRNIPRGLKKLSANPARAEEIAEVVPLLRERIQRVTKPIDVSGRVPLHLHAQYSRDEALAAFGVDNPGSMREGVRWVEDEKADVFFVTLRKTEKHYSPSTMYEDRAISPSLFQWESQSTTSSATPTGQRYVHHRERGSTVHLFMRESKEADGDLGAPPYLYAGPMSYVSHSGDRPMRVLWKLQHELPADMFRSARVAAS